MQNTAHFTDILNPNKDVTVGKQKQHWVEFQLVDELGEPLAHLPFRAANDATRAGIIPDYVGESDAEGIIRIEGLHPIPLTLWLSANPLAEMMQTRRLRTVREEPCRPLPGERLDAYGKQREGFSPIEKEAKAAGHFYHYLRIGHLCDELPVLKPALPSGKLPGFHFPNPDFDGFTVLFDELDRRSVLEVCPFRAWSLVLHHSKNYSLVNAYNLGLMSILAYSDRKSYQIGSVTEFFMSQCLDLSRIPIVWDDGQSWPVVLIDVPFGDRYTVALARDTSKEVPPCGDTQYFYATNSKHMVFSWRGTEVGFAYKDLFTDLTFRPVDPELGDRCSTKSFCENLADDGMVHLGFRLGYESALEAFPDDFYGKIQKGMEKKEIFICGHSLGGALGLIHAADFKKYSPVLYTYGMPRTFTYKAIQTLNELTHFRHVNDGDLVPRVPPDIDLDTALYDEYGALGTTLGFIWSLDKVIRRNALKHKDPFSHHGAIAMFYTAQQHSTVTHLASSKASRIGETYHSVTHKLAKTTKLYLVPSLDEEDSKRAESAQVKLASTMTPAFKDEFFPAQNNTEIAGLTLFHHFMSEYQPFIHNQLLESIDPELIPRWVAQREDFKRQMDVHRERISKYELERDRVLLALHSIIDRSLTITRESREGITALEYFKNIADSGANYKIVCASI